MDSSAGFFGADVDKYYDSCTLGIMTVDATACNTELKDLLLFEYGNINGNGNGNDFVFVMRYFINWKSTRRLSTRCCIDLILT